LENTIEKAVVMSTQDMITTDLLPAVNQPGAFQVKPLTEARDDFEKDYLKQILQLTGGNISRTAQIAGRYRADFYKLLKKHGLHPGDTKIEKDNDPTDILEEDPSQNKG
jgi:two-component system response regulator GlrR